MQLFLEIIDGSFDLFTIGLWVSICCPLSLSVSLTCRNDRVAESFFTTARNCPSTEGSQFDGIISYLARKCGGQVGNRGIVSITASRRGNPTDYPLRNVADFENRTLFCTNSEINSWICYEFKNLRIQLTHYSIHSRA
jgi:hypothetical protein